MGILSGPQIVAEMSAGRIFINPFNLKNVGPNSYDLSLADTLLIYVCPEVDPKVDNPTLSLHIPEEGMLLLPGRFYLGSTIEAAGSDFYIPCIEGRSSIARLGLTPHVSAGFGDCGFKRQWTLELVAAVPIRVYPGMRICQVYFHDLVGPRQLYKGKYVDSTGVTSSKAYEDFKR